jgi:hypothetical protein
VFFGPQLCKACISPSLTAQPGNHAWGRLATWRIRAFPAQRCIRRRVQWAGRNGRWEQQIGMKQPPRSLCKVPIALIRICIQVVGHPSIQSFSFLETGIAICLIAVSSTTHAPCVSIFFSTAELLWRLEWTDHVQDMHWTFLCQGWIRSWFRFLQIQMHISIPTVNFGRRWPFCLKHVAGLQVG